MSKQRTLGWGLCLWLVFGSNGTFTAHAQESDYDQWVRDALSEFEAGHFLESRALFLRAHQVRPSARTLRGLGQAAFGAQLYGQAVVDLSGAIGSKINPLTPVMRQEAEETIRRARTYTGRFRLVLDPPDSEVSVDGGSPIYDRDGALLLDAGRRQVVVRATGRVERETVLTVAGGEDKTLDLSVTLAAKQNDRDPIPEGSQDETPQQAPLELAPPRPIPAPVDTRPFPWLAVGMFGAAAVSGWIGAWQWQHRNARITSWNISDCRLMADDAGCRGLKSGWHNATAWGIVGFSLAGAFAATGVVLLVIRANDHSSDTALACGPMGPGMGCQLRM